MPTYSSFLDINQQDIDKMKLLAKLNYEGNFLDAPILSSLKIPPSPQYGKGGGIVEWIKGLFAENPEMLLVPSKPKPKPNHKLEPKPKFTNKNEKKYVKSPKNLTASSL